MSLHAPTWTVPEGWLRLTTIDAHTAGEPFRVVTGGWPPLEGATILARRADARAHHDHLRTTLMWEPRGHADMYGCVLTPPVTPGADLGVLFLHNEGFSTMCGHGVIALVTVLVEAGILRRDDAGAPVRIDTPAGLVTAFPRVDGGRVRSVAFLNVPAFVLGLGLEVVVDGLGAVRYDLAFGGAFYAYVRAADAGLSCTRADLPALIDAAGRIKRAVSGRGGIVHPFEPDLGFLYGVVFTEPARAAEVHTRNVCVFADGEVDRSPTGTSVSAQLAIAFERGDLEVGQRRVFESILGTRFSGRIAEVTAFGPHRAVVPEVEGSAHLTGRHEFVVDPDDALARGFLLR